MSKRNAVISQLREEAIRRADDDTVAQLLLKAADVIDALHIENEVNERVGNHWSSRQNEIAQLHALVKSIAGCAVGSDDVLRSMKAEIINIREMLTASEASP